MQQISSNKETDWARDSLMAAAATKTAEPDNVQSTQAKKIGVIQHSPNPIIALAFPEHGKAKSA